MILEVGQRVLIYTGETGTITGSNKTDTYPEPSWYNVHIEGKAPFLIKFIPVSQVLPISSDITEEKLKALKRLVFLK